MLLASMLAIGCVSNSSDSKVQDVQTNELISENGLDITQQAVVNPNQTGIFQYCTADFQSYPGIGESYTAPTGYYYAVATININNTGTETYSTNPDYWTLTIGGTTYNWDPATYASPINHQIVTVGSGDNITTQFAYLVKGTPVKGEPLSLNYSGPGNIVTSSPKTTSFESSKITQTTQSSDAVKTINTYDDVKWINVVGADTKPVTAALEDLTTSMNNFASTKNMSPAATAAEDLYDSTQTAILNSNSYAVSPDLQPIKDEYNQAMSDYNLASAYVYQAVKEYNNGNIDQSTSLLEDATYCIDSANSHINTAQKSLRVYSKKMGVTTNL